MNKMVVIFMVFSLFSCTKRTVNKDIQQDSSLRTIMHEKQEELNSLVLFPDHSERGDTFFGNKIEFESSDINFDGIEVLVYKNVINVVDRPSFFGQIISEYHFGDIIFFYEASGTKRLQNEGFDYWYKISQNENRWVNALSVMQFPFYIPSVEKNINFYSEPNRAYKGMIKFLSHEFIEDKVFLNTYNGSYPISPELEIEDLHFRILDNKHTKFLELVSDFSNIKNTIMEIRNECAEENKIENVNYEIYHTNDFYAKFVIWFDTLILLDLEIFNPQYILKHGIKVGISIDTVIELLGDPHTITDEEAVYYSGYPLTLTKYDDPSIVFRMDDDEKFINPCMLKFCLNGNIVNSIFFNDGGP